MMGSKKKEAEEEENEETRVVLTQNLLRVEETFVYKIPPMMTSGGHRAEDWNLAKPIATTALNLVRKDNTCLIQLMGRRPKPGAPEGATEEHLFAQSRIVIEVDTDGRSTRPVEYWVESVVDSSRYFVIRCEDERSNRQAFVGIGFRERNDALNFKMGLSEFIRAMEREKKAAEMAAAASSSKTQDGHTTAAGDDEVGGGVADADIPSVSQLSLKEGEKIHVDLGGRARKKHLNASLSGSTSITRAVGAGGLLLRRPPPPAGADPKENEEEKKKDEAPTTEVPGDSKAEDESGSPVAGGDTAAEDDDDWGDFESG